MLVKRQRLKLIVVIAAITMIASLIAGCGKKEVEQEVAQDGLNIVASTSWVAMIAKAAGADEITILAPVELRHPPEYDFRPSDIEKVQNADYVVFAGYEPFMNKLLESVGVAEEKLIRVKTENTPDNLKEQARELAKTLGTEEHAERWASELDELVEAIHRETARLETSSKKAIVQSHMVPMAEYFGYEVIAQFSEELSPAKTAELAALQPDIIIDNYHNVQGKAIEEIANVPRIELRNFPGPEHDSIEALLQDNAKKLGMEL